MSEKKIAECINIRIVPAKYEHIEITKYAERVITYENDEEMKEKEDALTQELLDNVIRNMRTIPERLGKKTDAVEKFEDSVKKKIPEWLENGPIPNIIPNGASKRSDKLVRDDHTEKEDKKADEKDMEVVIEGSKTKNDIAEDIVPKDTSTKQPEDAKSEGSADDMFGDDDDLFK